jgi:hypothetical protein
MSRKHSRSVAGTLCALFIGVALIASVSPAFAHHDDSGTANSNISMVYKARKGKFVGTVTSGNDNCLATRTVKLVKARSGAVVGKTTTGAAGGWSIAAKKNTGKYFSKVIAADYTLDSGTDSYGNVWVHELLCSGDKSGTVTTNR